MVDNLMGSFCPGPARRILLQPINRIHSRIEKKKKKRQKKEKRIHSN
jgi:hypothetical protein